VNEALNRDDFDVVIDWLPVHEADENWKSWCAEHAAESARLDPATDVLIDTGRTSQGDQRRYLIRRSAAG
jgi:hypothetical protein